MHISIMRSFGFSSEYVVLVVYLLFSVSASLPYMSICTRIIISVAFQKFDDCPYAYYKGQSFLAHTRHTKDKRITVVLHLLTLFSPAFLKMGIKKHYTRCIMHYNLKKLCYIKFKEATTTKWLASLDFYLPCTRQSIRVGIFLFSLVYVEF